MPDVVASVPRGAAVLMLVGACALVMAAIFPWTDFQGHPHWDRVGWIPFVSRPIRIRDMVLNVLLFMPLGATAAMVFRRGVLAAGLIAFGLSLTGEWLQLYSHGRFPSATDLVCNLAGALGAAWVVERVDSSPGRLAAMQRR